VCDRRHVSWCRAQTAIKIYSSRGLRGWPPPFHALAPAGFGAGHRIGNETLAAGGLIAAATQRAACGDAGKFPSVELQLAVDDDLVPTSGKLIGLDVSGVVGDGGGVEDGDVRQESRLQ
jgi:hypothetical protein